MKVFDAAGIRNVALVGHSGVGQDAAGLGAAVRRRRREPVRQGGRGHHRHRLRRRSHRPQAHAVGVARLPRVEQAQDQPDRHARHGQLPERRARGAARRRGGGRRRRRRRRRPGLDRKGLGRGRRGAAARASSSATGSIASAPASSARSSRCGRRSAATACPCRCRSARNEISSGVVDLVAMKAYTFAADDSGKMTEGAGARRRWRPPAQAARDALIEMVAEADDALMEKFFEAGTLTQDELTAGLARAVRAGDGSSRCSARRRCATSASSRSPTRSSPTCRRRPSARSPGERRRGRRDRTRTADRQGAARAVGLEDRWPIRSPGASRCSASSPAC